MKHNLLAAATLITLLGCSQPAPVTTQADTPVTSAATTPEAALLACPEQTGYQLMPAGVSLDIPYHVRVDRIYVHENGDSRRRIVLEYLEGDVETALSAADKSIVAAGFTAQKRRAQPNGEIAIPYAKKGHSSILVIAKASPGDKPSNPAAKGTLALDYVLDAGADSAPAAIETN